MLRRASAETPFEWYHVFFIGGVGALVPMLLDMMTYDFVSIWSNLQFAVIAGHVTRMVLYFVLGGLYVVFQKKLRTVDGWTVFQLGIVAPMAMSATLNAQPAPTVDAKPTSGLFYGVAYAQAQDNTQRATVPEVIVTPPQQSNASDKFWSGLLKKKVVFEWWVAGDTFETKEKAVEHATNIQQKVPVVTAPKILAVADNQYRVIYATGITTEATAKGLVESLRVSNLVQSVALLEVKMGEHK